MRRTHDSVEQLERKAQLLADLERKARLLADHIRASDAKVIYLYPRGGWETSIRNRVEVAFLHALTRSDSWPSISRTHHDRLRSMAEELGYTIHEWTPTVEEIT